MHRYSPLIVLALLTSAGCWKEHDTAIDASVVRLDNDHVGDLEILIHTYETELACPDGGNASFYVVVPESVQEPAPVAVLFHSGAFDYVKSPSATDFLDGTHYADENRLTASWSQERVFFTLGMWDAGATTYERQTGALPVALAGRGVVTIIPGNCWGDLWHNEISYQENDEGLDRFPRNGRGFAWWMLRILFEEDFAVSHDFTLPVEVDSSQTYLFGIGDGGRAIPELLLRMADPASDLRPEIAGFFMDSTPDDLSYYLSTDDRRRNGADELAVLDRLMPDAKKNPKAQPYGYFSLLHLLGGTPLGDKGGDPVTVDLTGMRSYIVWSQNDNDLPDEMIEPTTELLKKAGGTVENTARDGHTFANSDIAVAGRVLASILGEE